MLKNKYFICGLFFMALYCLFFIYSIVSDYFVMKNPNAYLTCGVRTYEYFDSYEKRSDSFRVDAYSIEHCKGGLFILNTYLALTDYESGYIYRAIPLNLSEDEMHFRDYREDAITITTQFMSDSNGKETFFCFYKPIPDVYRENERETKEEFIARYNKKLANLDRKECF